MINIHNHSRSRLRLSLDLPTTANAEPLSIPPTTTAHILHQPELKEAKRWSRRLVVVLSLTAGPLEKAGCEGGDEGEEGTLRVPMWRRRTGEPRIRLVEVGRRSRERWLAYHWRDAEGGVHLSLYDRPNLSAWMSSVPSWRPLSSLYLPGTHESLAIHGWPVSSCQAHPLSTQLEGGLRFLDLRFALIRGKLVAYHGLQSQFLDAAEAFAQVYDFLGRRRSECVVISVKQENATHGFEAKMWELLDRRREMWYTEDRWPNLGEARGKAVMFCRFGFKSRRGIHPEIWPDNSRHAWLSEIPQGEQPVVVQDWYSIGSFLKIPEKAALVLSLFNRPHGPASGSDPRSSPQRINFCSGGTFFTAFPFIVARGLFVSRFFGFRGVNERVLLDLVRSGREEGGQGGMVLLLDYFEGVPGLVELMVAWNF